MSLDPSTQAYIDAMVVKPPQAAINIIDTAIVGLKSAGVWSKLTWLSFLAGNTQQATMLNAINPAQTLAVFNSPTFIPYVGWQGNGVDAYLQGGDWSITNPNNQGFHFCYVSGGTDSNASNTPVAYGQPSGSNRNFLRPRITNNRISGQIGNSSVIASPNNIAPTIIGLSMMVRNADVVTYYKNGVNSGTSASTWDGSASAPMSLFRNTTNYTDYLLSVFGVGSESLTDQQAEDLHEITRAFVRDMARVPMRHSGVMSVAHGLMMAAADEPINATGGTITTVGEYKIHTFTSSGTFSVLSGGGQVEFLLVGGGGGGGRAAGSSAGGGGGAGGMIEGHSYVVEGNYSVTIGAGSAGSSVNTTTASNGGNSAAFGYTAVGGGGGGGSGAAGSGGSGGGGRGHTTTGNAGTGTSGQGFAGGDGNQSATDTERFGGGGGGAGGAGVAATSSKGGNGGAGKASSISGSSVTYAAGGGGGAYDGTIGTGGTGGGGNGGNAAIGQNATGYGCGGGGSARENNGGNGSGGIFIVRYKV